MSDTKHEASYCIGLSVGSSLKTQNLDGLSLEGFVEGLKTVLGGGHARYTPDQANARISAFLQEEQEKAHGATKAASEAFLAENAKRPEVTTLPSGLQYEVITEGTGPRPSGTSRVTVHYHGTLVDGTVFDSSKQRGQPTSFGVNQVIKGWTEALQLMPQGSTWKLYIPQDLAYGANPRPGGVIQPFMALVFEVELIGIG